MKSDQHKLDQTLAGTEAVLREAEKCARYCELNPKETLRLRLLAEELLGMMRGILANYSAEFWIEGAEKKMALHMRALADMDISPAERRALLDVSSSGTNAAAKGFMGKLGQLFACGLFGGAEEMAAASGLLYAGMDCGTNMLPDEWSLQRYRNLLERAGKPEAWDELEKSIVASFADDVTVAVRSDRAEITIIKDFASENKTTNRGEAG